MDMPSSHAVAHPLSDWIGRTTTIEDEITLPAVHRMAAMLDLDPQAFQRGSALPPHWYSMFFTLNARRSQVGPDGHPRKGEFLPPIALPRRMFVGRKASFPGVLRVGDQALKRSEIGAITEKQGRSGPLVFLTVHHRIEVAGVPVVTEQQEVVYREAAPAATAAPAAQAAAAPMPGSSAADWQSTLVMDPVLVFRYSALTWNGHRIHYDADYARREEGYPGCVMNGALTVHLLIDEALRQAPGYRLGGLNARLVKPLFVGGTLRLAGRVPTPGAEGVRLQAWATDAEGALAAEVELQLLPTA